MMSTLANDRFGPKGVIHAVSQHLRYGRLAVAQGEALCAMTESNGWDLVQGDAGDLERVLASARNVLSSDSAAHVLDRFKAVELLNRAITELSIPSTDYEAVKEALHVTYFALRQIPGASDVQKAMQTVARQFFDLKFP